MTESQAQYQIPPQNVPTDTPTPQPRTAANKSADCLKESVFWIYIGLMVLYGIIMLSVLVSSQNQLNLLQDSQSYQYGQQTIVLWDKKFIIDIKTATAGCPVDYEELLNYEWPGTIKGCNCPYTVDKSKQNFIVKGKCNSELLSYNCHDLEPINPEYLRTWKNRKKLCVKRDIYSFNTSPLDTCELNTTGFKQCGDGQRAVCLRSSTDCPVSRIKNTQIIVSSNSVGEPLEIDAAITYYFERQSISEYPIADFRLDEYDFCAHANAKNISPDQRGDYILLSERRAYCDKVDPRTVQLDTIGEQDLFKLNPELNKITRELPAYPRPSNEYTWKLGYTGFPQWSLECRLSSAYKLSEAKYRLDLEQEDYNSPLLRGFTYTSIVMVSFVLLLLEIRRRIIRRRQMARARRLKEDDKHVKRVGQVLLVPYSMDWARNTWILIILDRIFQVIHIPLIFIVYLATNNAVTWFDDVTTNQCGDEWFKTSVASEYRERLASMFEYVSTMLGLWWFIFIIDWAVLVFRYITEIRPAQNKEILIQQDTSYNHDPQQGTPVDAIGDESHVKPRTLRPPSANDQSSSAIFDDEDHLDQQKIEKEKEPQGFNVFDDQNKAAGNQQKVDPSFGGAPGSELNQRNVGATYNSPPNKKGVFDNQEILP